MKRMLIFAMLLVSLVLAGCKPSGGGGGGYMSQIQQDHMLHAVPAWTIRDV